MKKVDEGAGPDRSLNPTVSIIIPTYNRSELLSRAVKSILAQTYGDYEILVVDSSTTSETRLMLESFKDKRIRYFFEPKIPGFRCMSKARNRALSEARGRYIAFLDDDDEWLPMKLEKQMDLFAKLPPEVGLVYAGFTKIDDSGKVVRQYDPSFQGDVYQEALRACFLIPLTAVVRKECFDSLGTFDDTLEFGEDWDMWIRIASRYRFGFVPERLALYYRHGDSYKGDMLRPMASKERILKRHMGEMSRSTLAYNYHWLGVNYFLEGQLKKAIHFQSKAIAVQPRPSYVLALLLFPLGNKGFRAILRATGRSWEDG
jgi:glycosyltransferase involved in cell wall biosynthesis